MSPLARLVLQVKQETLGKAFLNNHTEVYRAASYLAFPLLHLESVAKSPEQHLALSHVKQQAGL